MPLMCKVGINELDQLAAVESPRKEKIITNRK